MKLLAIDTSTEACSAALAAGERRFYREHTATRGHAELILPMVDELLREAGLSLRELDGVAFARGPGSFTGVRLAASTVQGLAFGAGLGVIAVSSLEAAALRALELALAAGVTPKRVLVCNDARMNEVYSALYECTASGDFALLGREQVTSAARIIEQHSDGLVQGSGQSKGRSTVPCIGAGHGFTAYPELASLAGLLAIYPDALPRAREVLALALPRAQQGLLLSAKDAQPVYVRDDVAKIPAARA